MILLSGATGIVAQSATHDVITFETGKTPTREIHVATSGNDTTGDGSAANPYRTIGRGVQAATPGTAIRIHAGIYAARVSITDRNGTADAPIWIGGAPGEARPVIENVSQGIYLTRVRYVIVHDLEVRFTSDNGINADDGGDYANVDATRHVIFRNLNIHHVGSGGNQDCLKLSGVNDFYVLNSEFAFCGGGGAGSGIDHVGCHGGLIVGNYFHDLSANAVQIKGGSENIEIRANRMLNSGERAVNIGGSTGFQFFRPPLSTTQPNFEARNIRVIANVIEGSVAALAFVGAIDSLAANNTIVNPTNWLIRILQETTTSGSYQFLACANNTVANNLFYFDRSDLSTYVNIGTNTVPTTFVFANNLWYAHNNPAQSQPNLAVTETNGIVGQNPRLVNPAGGDYHLQSTSPAVAQGRPLSSVTTDYDGASYNNPPSIGAFEFLPRLVTPGTLTPNPTSVAFGGQSLNTTSPAVPVILNNSGVSTLSVNSLTTSTHFAVTHNCSAVSAGSSCTASVAFTPAAQGGITGTLTVVSSAGTQTVTLSGTGEKSLVTHYYRSILRRAPDTGGKTFWNAEAARVQALGVNVNEVWYAMAGSFYFSTEYAALNRDNAGFVTDLYGTFFNRVPDAAGFADWTGQLAAGMPREVVLASFMFSAEFAGFTQAIFGAATTRKEIDTVVDFFRGLLARLPDDGGFNFWLQKFRVAQCQGGAAVNAEVESISSQFAQGGEYAARARSNSQYVGDLYNAFLRRGGDLAGVQFWISQIAAGAQTREAVRRQFVASGEFNARVVAIIAQGCLQ